MDLGFAIIQAMLKNEMPRGSCKNKLCLRSESYVMGSVRFLNVGQVSAVHMNFHNDTAEGGCATLLQLLHYCYRHGTNLGAAIMMRFTLRPTLITLTQGNSS